MVSITHKSSSLRKAIAIAEVLMSPEAIVAIREGKVPKGDVLTTAKVAALFAAKKTSDIIPDCHPLPIEFTDVRFEVNAGSVIIETEIHTIYKTGVEVEAMHAASVAALTVYDMIKPIDKSVHIGSIKLKQKTGGKSDVILQQQLRAGVITCSDSAVKGLQHDLSGEFIRGTLLKYDIPVEAKQIVEDEIEQISAAVKSMHEKNIDLLFLTGGTGASLRDVTPQAIEPMLTLNMPGIAEAQRSFGLQRTPQAMLSRNVAGFINEMLVITLPGSVKGVEESLQALLPHVLHVFEVRAGKRHS